jgi:hypothetical protein
MNIAFSLNLPSDLAIIFGIIASAISFSKGIYEYIRQGSEKRALNFFKLEHEFFSSESNIVICKLIEDDSSNLLNVSYEDKVKFLGFIEQIALLVNSKLLSLEIASYVYGYYVLKCSDSINFWSNDMDKGSEFWNLFFSFSEKIKQIDIKKINPNSLKF